jgi:7,8-dihydropterin-6-yl-methyl-4-(beta-D-ribofuranosyl)aminobenzene 5'-phosphate synthase
MLKITNIYDNIPCNSRFKPDWGFGCIVDYNDTRIIFDTGAKPNILESNLRAASIDPSTINIAIISHKHWDHIGGKGFLSQQNPNIKTFAPKTFFSKSVNCSKQTNLISKNITIQENLHLIISKNIWINELALVIESDKGLVVVSGCSHTGIHNIANKASKYLQKDIYLLYGGFHLFRTSEYNIRKLCSDLSSLKVKKIAPSHCTGEKAFKLLKQEFGDNFIQNGCGKEIII